MSVLTDIAGGLLDGVDILFNAAASLARVTLRGAFSPDVKSYRDARFARLSAKDVLLQDVALNAEDAAEARRAIALDPESALPLSADTIAFDVAGPLPSEQVSARPERRFVLGVIRNDTLEELREELPFGRRGGVEAFVFSPPSMPDAALVFEDEPGRRRRRTRRAFTAIAIALFAYASTEAIKAGGEAFDRMSTAANSERTALERRIRVAEHCAAQAQASLAALGAHAEPSLAEVSHQMALLARTQATDSALNSVSVDGRALTLSGAAYSGDTTELALRRSFEGARVSFTAEPGTAPQTFQARVDQQARP